MKEPTNFLITVSIAIIGTLVICNILFEGVDKKLERTCALYGMDYHYRNNGQYCIEEDGTIHPIATNCPSPIKRGTCEIKFIK